MLIGLRASILASAAALAFTGARLTAQAGGEHTGHDMSGVRMGATTHARMASGTAWVPDSSPMRMLGTMRGAWMLSAAARAFLQFDDQHTKRGDTQLGVTDWEMFMAERDVRGGALRLAAMTTIEPFVLGGSGYPLLLQTGGTYRHSPLHDRQHPHDALMELSASYARAIAGGVRASLYAGAVGEPAIGPVATMHRPSAADDPMAPLGHHWQDASHQSYGVVTAGVETRTLRLEGSAFNAREADEHHLVADYRGAKLDSYSGRLSWAATPRVVASTWWGYLGSHERLDPSMRMHRYGGSLMTAARGVRGGQWASTLVWAMNLHHHGGASHALIHGAVGASPHHHSSSMLAETQLGLGTRSVVYARAEAVKKNGEELGFQGGDLTVLYPVQSFALGFTRDVLAARGVALGLGARGSVNVVPTTLLATYGTRTPTGVVVYARVRAGR